MIDRARLATALLALMASSSAAAHAQHSGPPLSIGYRVAMSDPSSHLYDVSIDIDGVRAATLPLQLPIWSPGRYARVDFAKNVQGLRALDVAGRALAWDKTDGSRWVVRTGGARHVRISYRVFANQLSGTYSVLDTLHANWNGAGLFMYVERHKPDPVTLDIVTPQRWLVINGDTRSAGQASYRFPNYDQLIDTPTEIAPALLVDSFTVDARKYRTVVHHNGAAPTDARQRFVRDVEKLVRYENSVFPPPPLDQYTFLFHVGFPGGDGMEHLYSTQVIDRRQWADSFTVLPGIGTAAHEYFHVWNVKRVRPAALGPFDYTREAFQPSLWVAEGWTQYYGQVALHRAGITDEPQMYRAMAALIAENLTAPGRTEVSARMASFHAPFWDGGAQQQPTNVAKSFISYYTKGAGLALYLDLFLRAGSGNARSLDDAFNALRRRTFDAPSASYYLRGRGYTELDVERAVSEVAGENMHAWFERHVGGTEDLDYDALLARAGLRLVRAEPWRIEELPDATPAQRAIRAGWLSGKRG
ncbi:MAG: M61 family metallopeptidase [Gemmatimonadaceae bacterium]|nr:M61 family metallopeptidase [Gemmatimonadaceae bacterium]